MIDDRNRYVRKCYVGSNEAARIAGCGRTTIHRAAVAGELPWAALAGRRVYRVADVEKWRADRERDRASS
jgi:hypothetical protein